MKIKYILILTALVGLLSCNESNEKKSTAPKKKTVTKAKVTVPEFSMDSAFTYVYEQVAFGPRIPNSEAHRKCAIYLKNKMKSFGADVIVQETVVKAFDGTPLKIKNIIAQYSPEKSNRILLCAHWDSRPFADHCKDPSRRDEPILGANDGASGVGVLMEIGRQLGKKSTNLGIDIIFFDAEDYGTPDHKNLPYKEDTWCLGSQYWGKNTHIQNYYARFGILLDMVGAQDAVFRREQGSMYWAPQIVDKVWNKATALGYSNYFSFQLGGQITDDHVYVNKYAKIPCINIIQYDPSTETRFGSYWHTHNDDMDVIDKNTLQAVGKTVMHIIYHEN